MTPQVDFPEPKKGWGPWTKATATVNGEQFTSWNLVWVLPFSGRRFSLQLLFVAFSKAPVKP